MSENEISHLFSQLISNILKTNKKELISKNLELALMYHNSGHVTQLHSTKYYYNLWKSNIKRKEELKKLFTSFKYNKLAILKVFDVLKGTSKTLVLTKDVKKEKTEKIDSIKYIDDNDLVKELFIVLQGGYSDILTFIRDKVSIEHVKMKPYQLNITLRVSRIGFCLHAIESTVRDLNGIIGMAIVEYLTSERQKFIKLLSLSQIKDLSLISLFSFVCGSKSERIEACAVICNLIDNNNSREYFTPILLTQNHGCPLVRSVGKELLDYMITAFKELSKEWIQFGVLNDPYDEFFVKKSKEEVDESNWWIKTYYIDSELIPPFITDENIIKNIISCGRAWNFIKIFKDLMMQETTLRNIVIYNSLAEISHTRKLLSSSELTLTDCLNESMSKVMTIIKKFIWIRGHIKVIDDFMLFFRGDFALSLYEHFSFDSLSTPKHLFNIVKNNVTKGKLYRNEITKEHLIENLEITLDEDFENNRSPIGVYLSYQLPKPLKFLISDKTIENYENISQFTWRLKCIEIKLNTNWKRNKKSPSIFAEDNKYFNQFLNGFRYQIIFTIRTIIEYISTDVLLLCANDLDKSLDTIQTFDQMLDILQDHVSTITMKLTLSQEFVEFNDNLTKLIGTIEHFNKLEDCINQISDDIIAELQERDEDTIDEEITEFINNMRRYHQDTESHIRELKIIYDDQFKHLLHILSDIPIEDKKEIAFLESRLRYCLPRKQ